VPRSREKVGGKLLGSLPFVSRTFEGHFKESPYVLDMDANLYVGPADSLSRDHHAAVEVIWHFLSETGRIEAPLREVLRDRALLLDAFAAFDRARVDDDDLPAGPCGQSVNQVKLRFYRLCRRLDREFKTRTLEPRQADAERAMLASVFVRDES